MMSKMPVVWHRGTTTFVAYYEPTERQVRIMAQRPTPSGMAHVDNFVSEQVLADSKIAAGAYLLTLTADLMSALDRFIERDTEDANPSN